MTDLIRQPVDDEPLCEAGDIEANSETMLLSGTGGDGSVRASHPRCWTERQGRQGLRVCTASACLGLAALCLAWHGVIFGPLRVNSKVALGNTVKLDAVAETQGCQEDEEFFGGLCYKKCMYLTGGYYPIRTSAMTCCESHPCGLFNQKHDMGFCSGFSVAGGKDGACPHPPGSCLPDEEMLVGQCYKKCSLLTEGKYSHRTAPGTCCNQHSAILCLLPKTGYSKSDPSFDVGGGTGPRAGFHTRAAGIKDVAQSTTTAASIEGTTALDMGQEQERITQPPLPAWYVEMQKVRPRGETTTKAPKAVAVEQATPPPVPDWAGGQQRGDAVNHAPTAVEVEQATRPPVPDWARSPTATRESAATRVPTTPAPTATIATASPTSPPPRTTSVAMVSSPGSETMLPRATSQPTSSETTASPQGTTVPEWLREILAEPEEAGETTRMPSSTRVAAQSPSQSPRHSSLASSQAPATATATTSTPASPTSTSKLEEENPHQDQAHAAQVARMPNWAEEMLNENELPSSSKLLDTKSGA